MSVALLIQPASAEPRIVPVATQEVFRRVWMPAAAGLGLAWVPLAETGFPLAPEDRPHVIAELRRLRDVFAASLDLAEQLPRLDALLAELERFRDDPTVRLYLG